MGWPLMIRPAVEADIPSIIEIGLQALSRAAIPGMMPSRARIEKLARLGVDTRDHFLWVAEANGQVGGVLAALVHDCLLYERRQATIVQFECRIPGDGVKLLRACRRWWLQQPMIKMLMISLEAGVDPRLERLFVRQGFDRRHPLMVISR